MEAGISMNPEVLRKQVLDTKLNPQVRASNLRSLLSVNDPADNDIILKLSTDDSELVRSVSYVGLLERKIKGSEEKAILAVREDEPIVARAIFSILAESKPEILIELWKVRELNLKNELWLDLYQSLSGSSNNEANQVAASFAAGDPV